MDLVTLNEVKRHLRIDLDDIDNDDYLENNIIKAATRKAEQFMCLDSSIVYTQVDCPEDIKQAVLVKCGELYDIDRDGYVSGNIRKTDLFERLLLPYKRIVW